MDKENIYQTTEIPTLKEGESEKEIENIQIEKEGGR